MGQSRAAVENIEDYLECTEREGDNRCDCDRGVRADVHLDGVKVGVQAGRPYFPALGTAGVHHLHIESDVGRTGHDEDNVRVGVVLLRETLDALDGARV